MISYWVFHLLHRDFIITLIIRNLFCIGRLATLFIRSLCWLCGILMASRRIMCTFIIIISSFISSFIPLLLILPTLSILPTLLILFTLPTLSIFLLAY